MAGVSIKCYKDTNYFTLRNFFCHTGYPHPARFAAPEFCLTPFNIAS